MGSIVIALASLLVRSAVLEYLRNRPLVFSETLDEVRGQQSKESDMARI